MRLYERESRPNCGYFLNNSSKAQCPFAGFSPDPCAFVKCFEFASPCDSTVIFFIIIVVILSVFSFCASRYVQKYCSHSDVANNVHGEGGRKG